MKNESHKNYDHVLYENLDFNKNISIKNIKLSIINYILKKERMCKNTDKCDFIKKIINEIEIDVQIDEINKNLIKILKLN